MSHPQPATLGQLKQTPYRYRSVKQELRENLIARLKDAQPLLPGIVGYRQTVLPQLIHAILSRHDILLLGLRGQAKTRMLRMLPQLLDEWIPILADLEIPDDPLSPMTTMGKRVVTEKGDDAPIKWLHRSQRYQEKLATPDVTIADLIGEIDIVKHAQGKYLSDESTMHFGLIPRANRGLFAINELPDLAPRIQVGLFNVLEERDVQIRGYPIRLSLDTCLVFSANPEDYTNRGRIVTPLKDRIGSVIRTHYPQTIGEAVAITQGSAYLQRAAAGDDGVVVEIPPFMHQIVEETVALARKSPHINQASGVSVRASIACVENMVSSAERRGFLTGEKRVQPRICDLAHLTASCRGKIELMLAEDGQGSEDKLIQSLVDEAVKAVFNQVAEVEDYAEIVDQFTDGLTLAAGDETAAADFVASMKHIDGLHAAARKLAHELELDRDDDQAIAATGEFILEALYVSNRLSKSTSERGSSYRR